MTTTHRRIAVFATAALLALPGVAAAGPKADHGKSHAPATAPTTSSGNAYGKACQGQSRKHVKGQKGTPFSQCVTAMAKLASGEASSPKAACKGLSHKHVKGQKGTPFSQCVKAAAKLEDDSGSTSGDDAGTPPGSDAPAPADPGTSTDTTPSA